MKLPLAVLLLAVALPNPAFAVMIDPVAQELCADEPDAKMCAYKVSSCIDDMSTAVQAEGGPVTNAVIVECARREGIDQE